MVEWLRKWVVYKCSTRQVDCPLLTNTYPFKTTFWRVFKAELHASYLTTLPVLPCLARPAADSNIDIYTFCSGLWLSYLIVPSCLGLIQREAHSYTVKRAKKHRRREALKDGQKAQVSHETQSRELLGSGPLRSSFPAKSGFPLLQTRLCSCCSFAFFYSPLCSCIKLLLLNWT